MFRSSRDAVRMPKESRRPSINEVYHCDMCDADEWYTENDVEIHRKDTHHQEVSEIRNKHRDRFCTVCMRLQETKEDLLTHIKVRHLLSSPNAQRVERQIYICDDCNNIFFNKDLLAAHIIYAHLTQRKNRNNKYFTCPKCFQLVRVKTMWFHLQKHSIQCLSLCDICLTAFPNQAELQKHLPEHKPYLKCEMCNHCSTKREQYDLHLESHKIQPMLDHPMKINRNMFKRYKPSHFYKYNIHNASRGLFLPNFIDICTLCREICTSKEELAVHLLRGHVSSLGARAKKVQHVCVCGEEFEYRIMLKQHVYKLKEGHGAAVSYNDIQTQPEIQNMTANFIEIEYNPDDNMTDIETPDVPSENHGNLIELEYAPDDNDTVEVTVDIPKPVVEVNLKHDGEVCINDIIGDSSL